MFRIHYAISIAFIALIITSSYGKKILPIPNSNEIFVILGKSDKIDPFKSLLKGLYKSGYSFASLPSISNLNSTPIDANLFYIQVDSLRNKSEEIKRLKNQLASIKLSKGMLHDNLKFHLLVHAKTLDITSKDLASMGASSLYQVDEGYNHVTHLIGTGSFVIKSLINNLVEQKQSGTEGRVDDWKYGQNNGDIRTNYTGNVVTQRGVNFVQNHLIQPNSTPKVPAALKVLSPVMVRTLPVKADMAVTAMESLASSKKRFSADKSMGFSVGGAMSVANFRERINNNLLPLPGDLTYEGLFSDYYFDTAADNYCKALFCPSYSIGMSPDPLSANQEYYVSVGLNSGMKASDMKRKKLNLVVVLDISGSMGGTFKGQFNGTVQSKMELANQSLVSLTHQLNDDDRLGVVLFNNQAFLAKPLSLVGDTDMEAIRAHIMEVSQGGGTNMEDGFTMGASLLQEYSDSNKQDYENRIVFLTDAMPNIGSTGVGPLTEMISSHAEKGIYTSFIGVGIDSNSALINHLSNIKGANYHAVNSATKFKQVLADEFDYMVNPLVFDLTLSVESQGFEVEKVFGSSAANIYTGEILKIPTLFPSSTKDGETKGGIVLLKLKKIAENKDFKVKVSYVTRNGETKGDVQFVDFSQSVKDSQNNLGVRKGILLSRYGSLLKHWMADERGRMDFAKPVMRCSTGVGIPVYEDYSQIATGRKPLNVHPLYQSVFFEFSKYFAKEVAILKDDSLKQELSILERLSRMRDVVEHIEEE